MANEITISENEDNNGVSEYEVTMNFESDYDNDSFESDVDAHSFAEEVNNANTGSIIVWDCYRPGWA